LVRVHIFVRLCRYKFLCMCFYRCVFLLCALYVRMCVCVCLQMRVFALIYCRKTVKEKLNIKHVMKLISSHVFVCVCVCVHLCVCVCVCASVRTACACV